MKKIAALVLAGAFAAGAAQAQSGAPASAATPSGAAGDAQAAAAVQAANRWLALMDAGQAGESWDAAAPILQAAVTRASWIDIGKSVRAPLGEVKSRKQASAVFTRTLPGVPEGEYVVIQYASDFAGRAGVVETVVPMRLPDGSWKVTTYRLR